MVGGVNATKTSVSASILRLIINRYESKVFKIRQHDPDFPIRVVGIEFMRHVRIASLRFYCKG